MGWRFTDNYAIIPNCSKSLLIKELYYLGVSKEILFHGVTDIIEGIVKEKEWDIEKINNIQLK